MEAEDRKVFYTMVGQVEATHEAVKEIKADMKDGEGIMFAHHNRIAALENRNKNIKENCKRVGWISVSIGAIVGGAKAVFAWLV